MAPTSHTICFRRPTLAALQDLAFAWYRLSVQILLEPLPTKTRVSVDQPCVHQTRGCIV